MGSNSVEKSMKAAEANLYESMSLRMCSVAHYKSSVVENLSGNQTVKDLKDCVFLRNDVFVPSKLFQRSSIVHK